MRSCFLFIGASLLTFETQAQEPYSHYLDPTCIWYQEMAGVDVVGITFSRVTIYIDGDTLLNGIPFFKQYYTRWDSAVFNAPVPPVVTTYGPNYYRALREDDQDRFWEWRDWLGTDVVINDFDLVVGDTFPDEDCTIDSMDVIYFNGDPLKHFLAAGQLIGNGVIEGIGNTGLLCSTGIEGNWWWTCFSKQGHTLQIDTTSDCSLWPAPIYLFQVPLGIHALPAGSSIRAYPNPVNDRLNVEWRANEADELVLLNAQGMIVERQVVVDRMGTQLTLSTCGTGVYLLQLKKAGRIVDRQSVIKD